MPELSREDLPGFLPMQPILKAVMAEYQLTLVGLFDGGKTPTPLEARQLCCWLYEHLDAIKRRVRPREFMRVLGRARADSMKQGIAATERRRASDEVFRTMTDRLLSELRHP